MTNPTTYSFDETVYTLSAEEATITEGGKTFYLVLGNSSPSEVRDSVIAQANGALKAGSITGWECDRIAYIGELIRRRLVERKAAEDKALREFYSAF